ncbi:MAG: metalloregulator ArsR/SmtB family transcription factor [Actinomycetota bacterium]|nr:winged helix-turn-helix transcriptional regulator [Actinomycetota bacterium]MDQ3085972.1 metalloregulator ArsR/SmtB family transcription factor [Actinomycetota bacterium]
MAADDTCDLLCIDLDVAERLRHELPDPAALATVVERARALADPTRLSILLALRSEGELCGCDLAWILGRSQALISHHLRALREARLVSSRRQARMVFYSLTAEANALLEAVGSEVFV